MPVTRPPPDHPVALPNADEPGPAASAADHQSRPAASSDDHQPGGAGYAPGDGKPGT